MAADGDSTGEVSESESDDEAYEVELAVKGFNLRKMDWMSESDPCCVMYTKVSGRYVECGRTEWQKDCPNPVFVKTFKTKYNFELRQDIRFEMYDIDNAITASMADDDFIGLCDTTL